MSLTVGARSIFSAAANTKKTTITAPFTGKVTDANGVETTFSGVYTVVQHGKVEESARKVGEIRVQSK